MAEKIKFLLLIFLTFPILAFSQEESKKSIECKEVVQIPSIISPFHIHTPVIDENVLEGTIKSYLNLLDPRKIYLLEDEYLEIIKNFKKNKYSIFKELKQNNCSVFLNIKNKIYKGKKRVHELTVSSLVSLKDQELEKSKLENVYYLRKHPYTNFETESQLASHIVKDITFDTARHFKSLKNKKVSLNSIIEQDILEEIEIFEKKKKEKSFDYEKTILKSLLQSFDPHSSYMNKKETLSFIEEMRTESKGIGIQISSQHKEEKSGLKIMHVYNNSPAQKAGLRKYDIILSVNKKNKIPNTKTDKALEYFDLNPDEVELKIKRRKRILKKKITKEVYISDRERVKFKFIKYKGKRIGLVNLPTFYMNKDKKISSSIDFIKAYKELYQKYHIELLILDLRNNPGGLLDEATRVAGLFVPEKTIVKVKNVADTINYKSPYDSQIISLPTVVLVNKKSASASEIVAAALKNYGKALIVGDNRTYGKGSVQTILDAFMHIDKGAVKITTKLFFDPNNRPIQHVGVRSDVIIPSLSQINAMVETNLMNSLANRSDAENDYHNSVVSKKEVETLRKKSEERVLKNVKFKEFKDIKTYILKHKENDKEKDFENTTISGTLRYQDDLTLEETLNIAVDYLNR